MRSWRSKTKMTPRQLARGRAELILARDDRYPLRDVPLGPDPLTAFAWVMGRLKSDEGEAVDVVVDLLAVGHWPVIAGAGGSVPLRHAGRRGLLAPGRPR